MKKGLKSISANNKMAFYLDKKSIGNQELVRSEINYIKTTRKDIFTPLAYLNLVLKQRDFVYENSNNPIEVKKTLLALPLNDIQKHILYNGIIKWFGGLSNGNLQLASTLRMIENEFKKYKSNTPEKDLYFSRKPQYQKLTFQQIARIKFKFDKLPYPEKLIFWDNNFYNETHYLFSSIGFYRENEIEEGWGTPPSLENSISIYPKDKAETVLHNHWLLNHIQTDNATKHCNIEKLKEKYIETITNNPRPKEFTEQEIDIIKKRRDTEKRLKESKSNIAFWGYYSGYQSVVKKENTYLELSAEDFKRIAESYAKGIADAFYLGFLEEQIEGFKKRENLLLQNNESLPDKNNTNSINGKKFYNPDDFKHMIIELLKLDPLLSFYVTDFLEFHYSQAAFTNWWSRVNWFTMFRKTLFVQGYSDDKDHVKDLPAQIRNAFHWERQKSFDLVKAHNVAKQIKQEETLSNKQSAKKEKNPKTFDNLFNSLKEANASIQILKDVEPPVINENGHFILGSHSKGAITAWVQAHKQKGKIATCTDKDIAVLLNAEIAKLNIDERTLRNTGTTAYTKYFTQILALI